MISIGLRVSQGPSLCSAGNRAERKKQGDQKPDEQGWALGPGDVREPRKIEVDPLGEDSVFPVEVAFSVPS